jgi:hypothetical protein
MYTALPAQKLMATMSYFEAGVKATNKIQSMFPQFA